MSRHGSRYDNYTSSYSGTDMVVSLSFPGVAPVTIGTATTITYSIYRQLAHVRTLGRISSKGYARGVVLVQVQLSLQLSISLLQRTFVLKLTTSGRSRLSSLTSSLPSILFSHSPMNSVKTPVLLFMEQALLTKPKHYPLKISLQRMFLRSWHEIFNT